MSVLYSAFIATIRRELRDLDYLGDDKFNGDGTTVLFPLLHRPIKTNSYVVTVDGVVKTINVDYTIDTDTGFLTLVVAPANLKVVEVTYRYQKMSDQEYIDAINDAIDRWRWKLWKDVLDSTTFTTVKNQYEYDLSTLTGILYVVNAWLQPASGSTEFQAISGITNYQYMVAQQKLAVNPTFDVAGLKLKFRYLKALTKGSAVTDTLDILPEWYAPFKMYVKGVFFDRLVPEKIFETGAVTTIPTFTPAQLAYQMSTSYIQQADILVNRIAPRMPNLLITNRMDGVTL